MAPVGTVEHVRAKRQEEEEPETTLKPETEDEKTKSSSREDKQIPDLPDEFEIASVDEINDPESERANPATTDKPKIRFVYHPYYGYVPLKKATAKAQQHIQYEYNPYYGYTPVSEKTADPDRDQFVYHSYHGYIPMYEMKQRGIPEEADLGPIFKYDPNLGYTIKDKNAVDAMTKEVTKVYEEVIDAVTKEVKEGAIDVITKEVKNRIGLGDDEGEVEPMTKEVKKVLEERMNQKYLYDPYLGFVALASGNETGKAERRKFYYDPLYGYIPVRAKKGENDSSEKKFIYDSVFGYIALKPKTSKDNETTTEGSKKRKEFYYEPSIGYLPVVEEKSGNNVTESEQKRQEFYYDPFYGYTAIKEKSRKDNETEDAAGSGDQQLFSYDPINGFVPDYPEDGISAALPDQTPKISPDVYRPAYDSYGSTFNSYRPTANPYRPPANPFKSAFNPYRSSYYPYNQYNPYYVSGVSQVIMTIILALYFFYPQVGVDFIKVERKAQIIEIALSICALRLRPTF